MPAALLGTLAVARKYEGRGLGSALIADTTKRLANADLATCIIVVDAKDEEASKLYPHLGFITLPDSPLRLVMSIETALKAMRSS